MSFGYHITHNDGDAVGCALVAEQAFPNIEIKTVFCAIGTTDNEIDKIIEEIKSTNEAPKFIIISDISISREKAIELEDAVANEQYGTRLYGFDHHLTNPCSDIDWWTIHESYYDPIIYEDNILISAAEIMYNRFKSTIELNCTNCPIKQTYLEYLIKCISRYDTWEWKKHPDNFWFDEYKSIVGYQIPENLIADVTKFIGPEDSYENLCYYYNNFIFNIEDENKPPVVPDKFITIYEGIQKTIENEIFHARKYIKVGREGEYIIASYIGEGQYSNMVSDAILSEYPEIDIVKIIYPSTCTFGFRTKKDDINLARYASRIFGGGGHKQASGAHVSPDSIIIHLNKHYNSLSIEEFFSNSSDDE